MVATCLGALQRLHMLCMTSIESYIVELMSLVTKLKNMDKTLSSEQQAMILLCSLLSSYKHFHEMHIYGHKSIKIDDVKPSLLCDEKMEHDSGRYDNTASNLVIRGRSEDIGLSSNKGKSRSKYRHCKGRLNILQEKRALESRIIEA